MDTWYLNLNFARMLQASRYPLQKANDMPTRQRNVWILILGVLLLVAGVAMFIWYNTTVLTPAEIQRLEAGGSGEDTAFESFALFGSPIIALSGLLAIVMALWSTRKQKSAVLNQYS